MEKHETIWVLSIWNLFWKNEDSKVYIFVWDIEFLQDM